jgi:hypothetical protein
MPREFFGVCRSTSISFRLASATRTSNDYDNGALSEPRIRGEPSRSAVVGISTAVIRDTRSLVARRIVLGELPLGVRECLQAAAKGWCASERVQSGARRVVGPDPVRALNRRLPFREGRSDGNAASARTKDSPAENIRRPHPRIPHNPPAGIGSAVASGPPGPSPESLYLPSVRPSRRMS